MNDYLIPFIEQTLSWLKTASAWTTEQLPLYVGELINYFAIKNIILFLLYFAIGVIPPIIGAFLAHKANNDEDSWAYMVDADQWGGFLYIFAIFNIGTVYHLLDLIKILVAPRVWIIEYLSKMF